MLVTHGRTNRRAATVSASLAGLITGASLLGFPLVAQGATSSSNVTPALARLAERAPARTVDVIVQFRSGAALNAGTASVRAAGGDPGTRLALIDGLQATIDARGAVTLSGLPGVRAVTLNGRVDTKAYSGGLDKDRLASAYNQSIGAEDVWSDGAGTTGQGVGVAVIDSGIAGSHVDFRKSQTDAGSRVVASVVVNPDATSPNDTVGHGTHVAGLIAGNGSVRPSSDRLDGRYAGVAPQANLVNVKVADDRGNATVADVINGLQFVVDKKSEYNIRVANLSLASTVEQSYTIDPLDAAVEQAWFAGVTVVAASGNSGPDSVKFAPGNDPYAISVGGADDRGTKDPADDVVAPWTSTGDTQDGVRKPEVMAPGARLVSTLAPRSDYSTQCPSCVVSGQYLRLGGTSMAAGVVSGAAALLAQVHPEWTPDQVKAALVSKQRDVPGVGGEIAVDDARGAAGADLVANVGLTASTFIDVATGRVDPTRTGWGGYRWDAATGGMRTGWGGASFVCSCVATAALADDDPRRLTLGGADPTRTGWGRTGWGRTGWGAVAWETSFTR
jgi:serine protease AprX